MTLATVVVFPTFLAIASAGSPWLPEPRTAPWWQDIHKGFVENTLTNGSSINVLFYGDSITHAWIWNGKEVFEEYYAPLGTANYGISADRTEHMRWRIQNGEVTDMLKPKLCVMLIGTNDLSANDDMSIAVGIIYNVIELRERLPNSKVLVLGVLPRNNESKTNRTSNINEVLKQLDNGKSIRFLDMKDHFYKDGNISTELYNPDLLHLSPAGYRKWAEVMDPLFKNMLNSN